MHCDDVSSGYAVESSVYIIVIYHHDIVPGSIMITYYRDLPWCIIVMCVYIYIYIHDISSWSFIMSYLDGMFSADVPSRYITMMHCYDVPWYCCDNSPWRYITILNHWGISWLHITMLRHHSLLWLYDISWSYSVMIDRNISSRCIVMICRDDMP